MLVTKAHWYVVTYYIANTEIWKADNKCISKESKAVKRKENDDRQ